MNDQKKAGIFPKLGYCAHVHNVSKMCTVCFRNIYFFTQLNISSGRLFWWKQFTLDNHLVILFKGLFSSLYLKNNKSLIPLKWLLFETILKTIQNYFGLFFSAKWIITFIDIH